jgi:hypothetical protein
MKYLLFLMIAVTLPVAASAQNVNLTMVDRSTPYAGWNSSFYDFSQGALQNQEDAVNLTYHPRANITVYGFGVKAPAGAWSVYIQNTCSWEGHPEPAFHWMANGVPYACIASNNGGGYWWMTRAMEHETTEAIGDPSGTHREIVDPVSQYFGMIDAAGFTFNYAVSTEYGPFVDFLIPVADAKVAGFTDYLKQETE